ncbi:unnamed protein product [Pleuronectes platessa]|uniref:Uncharacterized protein n=1 Tax=Pleuronectes platessa TaxID=8262 RepID=A0A9N7U1P3_PLEPL|nr:unnamed protein product [Pleuronectes platessa]
MSTPNLAHIQLDLVITGLVMYTIKKAKVPPSLIDAHSLIKHLSEKAKQQIKHDATFVTTFQNVEKIHKAVFKEVLKKIGTAKEVLQFMETQRVDSIFIDELRIQLMSPPPKKKGCFGRFVSSIGKLFRGRKVDIVSEACRTPGLRRRGEEGDGGGAAPPAAARAQRSSVNQSVWGRDSADLLLPLFFSFCCVSPSLDKLVIQFIFNCFLQQKKSDGGCREVGGEGGGLMVADGMPHPRVNHLLPSESRDGNREDRSAVE